ncbi:MAG: bifunctional riboflavin kinase/FAD synthetase [Candidatus Omnitrophica bacterium]|nr:bifunctional riboflavin kinase/FAD synthetase [Candidatus Omnitrophota bacterium]
MKVISNIGQAKPDPRKTILVIGVFDGVHIGHQKLIRYALKRAYQMKGVAALMTFQPHPVHVLRPEQRLPLLTNIQHRLQLIASMGIHKTFVVRFNKRFAQLSPENFIKRYIEHSIDPVEIVVGEDFRFGANRTGNPQEFKELGNKYGFQIHFIQSLKKGSHKIGSSLIRELVTQGKLTDVKKFLGRPFSFLGTVERGDQRGKKLGFPTANLYPQKEVIPPIGVYAVKVRWKGRVYPGMANVGRRPSFRQKKQTINIEVHIFDIQKDLYGETIEVQFIKKIRNEKYFPQQALLIQQLKKDELACRRILT